MLQKQTKNYGKSNAVCQTHLPGIESQTKSMTPRDVQAADGCSNVYETTISGTMPDCDIRTSASATTQFVSATDLPVTVIKDALRCKDEYHFWQSYRINQQQQVSDDEENNLIKKEFTKLNEVEMEMIYPTENTVDTMKNEIDILASIGINSTYRYPIIHDRHLQPVNWNDRLYHRYTGPVINDLINYSVSNNIMRILEENFYHMCAQQGKDDEDIAKLTLNVWNSRNIVQLGSSTQYVPLTYNCRYAYRFAEHLSNNPLTVATIRRLRYNVYPSDEAFKWLMMALTMAVKHPHPRDTDVKENLQGYPKWKFPGPLAVDRAVKVFLGSRGLIHGFNSPVPDFVQEILVSKDIYWPKEWSTYTDTDGGSSRRSDSPGACYTDSDVNGETGPSGINNYGVIGNTTESETSSCLSGENVPISRLDMFHARKNTKQAKCFRRFDKYVRSEHRERRQRREIRRARRLERQRFDQERRNLDVAYDAEAVCAEKLACRMARDNIYMKNRLENERLRRENVHRQTRKIERAIRREQKLNQLKVDEPQLLKNEIPIRTREEYRYIRLGRILKEQITSAWKSCGDSLKNNQFDFHCWVTPVRWIRQNGPNCGLAVLAMALRPLITCEVAAGGGMHGGSYDPEGKERTTELKNRMLHVIRTNQNNYYLEHGTFKNNFCKELLTRQPLTLFDLQVIATNNLFSNHGEMFSARTMYELGNLSQNNWYNIQLVEHDLLRNFNMDLGNDRFDMKSEPAEKYELMTNDSNVELNKLDNSKDDLLTNLNDCQRNDRPVEEHKLNDSQTEDSIFFNIGNAQRVDPEINDEEQNMKIIVNQNKYNVSDECIDNLAHSDNETIINGDGKNYENLRGLNKKLIVKIPNTPSLPLSMIQYLIPQYESTYNYPKELNGENNVVNYLNDDNPACQSTSNDNTLNSKEIYNTVEKSPISLLNVVQRLTSGQLIAVCFDCDKNMRPSDKNFGKTAHWALLCGVIIGRMTTGDELLNSTYDGSDLDLERDADRVWVVARHGKSSGGYSVWSLRELANSNRQLLRPSQKIMDSIPQKVLDIWEHDHTFNQLYYKSSVDKDTDDGKENYDDFPEAKQYVMTGDYESSKNKDLSVGNERMAENSRTQETPSISSTSWSSCPLQLSPMPLPLSSPPPPPTPPPPPPPLVTRRLQLMKTRKNIKQKPFILPDGPRLDLCLANKFVAFQPIHSTHLRIENRFRTTSQPEPSPLSSLLYNFKL